MCITRQRPAETIKRALFLFFSGPVLLSLAQGCQNKKHHISGISGLAEKHSPHATRAWVRNQVNVESLSLSDKGRIKECISGIINEENESKGTSILYPLIFSRDIFVEAGSEIHLTAYFSSYVFRTSEREVRVYIDHCEKNLHFLGKYSSDSSGIVTVSLDPGILRTPGIYKIAFKTPRQELVQKIFVVDHENSESGDNPAGSKFRHLKKNIYEYRSGYFSGSGKQAEHEKKDYSDRIYFRVYSSDSSKGNNCYLQHGYGVNMKLIKLLTGTGAGYWPVESGFNSFQKIYYSNDFIQNLLGSVCKRVIVSIQDSVSSSLLKMIQRTEAFLRATLPHF